MKSFEKKFIDNLVIPNNFIAIIRQIGEHKGKQDLYKRQAPEMLENLRQVAVIQSTESSNRLEGIIADINAIERLVLQDAKPTNRTEGEIAGYRDVLNTIHNNFKNIPFKDSVILQLHRDLMKYAGKEGGKWKSTKNEITQELPDGTKIIRFVPVEPHLTPEYMRSLHERYDLLASEQKLDPLILIPLFVLDFLCIHPFLDGNGRMARLITVLLLYHNNYEVGRYISLERIIEQTKDSYYETLYKSSQGWYEEKHDVIPWIDYFLSTLLASYREFEERFTKIISGKGSKTEIVHSAIKSIIGEFTISELEKACPTVSRDMIRRVLFNLRDEGEIEPLGKGRYAKWRKV